MDINTSKAITYLVIFLVIQGIGMLYKTRQIDRMVSSLRIIGTLIVDGFKESDNMECNSIKHINKGGRKDVYNSKEGF